MTRAAVMAVVMAAALAVERAGGRAVERGGGAGGGAVGCRGGPSHMQSESGGSWHASASCRLRKGCPGAMYSTRTFQSRRGAPMGSRLCAWAARSVSSSPT